MTERVLCRPGPHAPPGAPLKPEGPAYKLNREREYWVDAGLVEECDYWVPVDPMPEPDEPADELEGSVSGSDSNEGEPNPSYLENVDAAEDAAESDTADSSGEAPSLVCGAEKSNGEPCQRTVDEPEDHCWQHEE